MLMSEDDAHSETDDSKIEGIELKGFLSKWVSDE